MFGKNLLERTESIFDKNSKEFNMSKTIEELQELALILTQQMNKPTKDLSTKVEQEIAHVEIRMLYLKSIYSKKQIKKEIYKKLKQIEKKC